MTQLTKFPMSESEGTWTSPEGKTIPYVRETYQIFVDDDDWNDYFLQITKWPKNTTVEICVLSGEDGCDSDERWIDKKIYRFAKLSHAEFDEQKNQLINKAVLFVQRLTGN